MNKVKELIKYQQLPLIYVVVQVSYSSEASFNRAFKKSRCDETILPFINHIQINSNVWTNYSMIDTITSNSKDGFRVILSGGFSNTLPGNTFFDPCTLELLE